MSSMTSSFQYCSTFSCSVPDIRSSSSHSLLFPALYLSISLYYLNYRWLAVGGTPEIQVGKAGKQASEVVHDKS